MIQALAPKRSNQTFSVRILPRRSRRDRAVTKPHRPASFWECPPIGAVIVTHQIGRRRAPRERLHDLLRQPVRRRVPGHREPKQLSSTVAHDEKCKQTLECQRWNNAEIDRRDGLRMVVQECPPCL